MSSQRKELTTVQRNSLSMKRVGIMQGESEGNPDIDIHHAHLPRETAGTQFLLII